MLVRFVLKNKMFPVVVFVFALLSSVQAGNSSESIPRAEFEELKLMFEEMKLNFEDKLNSLDRQSTQKLQSKCTYPHYFQSLCNWLFKEIFINSNFLILNLWWN